MSSPNTNASTASSDCPSTSTTAPVAGTSYRKAEKRHYQKWMSNEDISKVLQSTKACSDTLEIIKKLEAEGKIEKDTASEFIEFAMRFQLPSSDYPGFSEAELLQLTASLESQYQTVGRPEGGSSVSGNEMQRERTSNGDERRGNMNQVTSAQGAGANIRTVDDRSPENSAQTRATGMDNNALAPYAPNNNAEYEAPNALSQLENVVLKQEVVSPPRELTPPPNMDFLLASAPKQQQIQMGGEGPGPSTSMAMMELQRPPPRIFHQSAFRPPVGRLPRADNTFPTSFYNPHNGQVRPGLQVAQPVFNGISGTSQQLVPFTATGSAPTRLSFNFPFSSMNQMDYLPVNSSIVRSGQIQVGPQSSQGVANLTPSRLLGKGMPDANGRAISTPVFRSNLAPMITAPASQTISNPTNSMTSLASNNTERQLQCVRNAKAPSQQSSICRNRRLLRLSPYITAAQAKARVRELGAAAAQREINDFAALIDARKPRAGNPFPMPSNGIRAPQHGTSNFRPIAAPPQVRQSNPNQLVRRTLTNGKQIEVPRHGVDVNNNNNGQVGSSGLRRRFIIEPPPSIGPVSGLANTTNSSNIYS